MKAFFRKRSWRTSREGEGIATGVPLATAVPLATVPLATVLVHRPASVSRRRHHVVYKPADAADSTGAAAFAEVIDIQHDGIRVETCVEGLNAST